MKKTIKIEMTLMRLNLQALFEYRTNAILIFFGSALYNLGAVLFISFLFSKIPLITGWDKWDLIFLYGVGQFFAYIYLFSTYRNGHDFVRNIEYGNIDFFLTKPVNSLIFTTLHSFSFEHLLSLIQPFIIIAYALSNKSYEISYIGILVAIISLALSLVIAHLINVISLIPSFWSVRNQFYRFFNQTADLINYPYEIFDTKLTRFIFFIIIPYAIMTNIPFRAIIGELDFNLFILQVFVCAGFILFTSKLWKFGVKNYSSASS